MFTQSFLLIAAFTTTLNALYEDCDHYGSTPIGFCDVGIELNCEQTVSGEWNLHRTEFAKADCSGDVINETILDIPEHAYHCGSGECAVEDLMIIEVGHENAAGLCSDFTASMLIQNECISGLYITANPTLQAVKLFCNEIEQTISYLSWDNDDCAGDSLQQNEVLLIDVDEIQDRYNTSDLCIELICHEADSGESSDDTTYAPTDVPTAQPTLKPTSRPTDAPTIKPTKRPTSRPTDAPTRKPTERPTSRPTDDLSDNSGSSSNDNSGSSSSRSSSRNKGWRESVSSSSSDDDTYAPTDKPSLKPTSRPTRKPTVKPTPKPTTKPTSDSDDDSDDDSGSSSSRSGSRSGSNGWRKNRKSRNRSNGRRKYRKSNRNNRSS